MIAATPPTTLDDLYSALDTEARLMAGFADALAQQRAGVASDDAAMVDASTHAMTRSLLTLEEVGRRRAELIEALTGDSTGRLGAVEAALGPLPRLIAARNLLRTRGEQVVRDLSVTQTVLKRALRSGEQYLQAILSSAAGPRPGYSAGKETVAPPARGVLLNTSA